MEGVAHALISLILLESRERIVARCDIRLLSNTLKAHSLILLIASKRIGGRLPLLGSSFLLLFLLDGLFGARVAEVKHELWTEVLPSQRLDELN